MNTLRPIILLLSLVCVLCSGSAHAALIMTVDSSSKTFTFGTSSTAPGTPTDNIGWQTPDFPFGPDNAELDVTSALQAGGASIEDASLEFFAPGGTASVGLNAFSTFSVVSGTGSSISDAGLSSSLQQGLETFAAANHCLSIRSWCRFR